jgi:hypothetical protein
MYATGTGPARALLVAAALAAVTACGRDRSSPTPLTAAETARAEALGDSATGALVGALGARLQQALGEGGAPNAMEFCAGMAQTLTDSVAARLGEATRVGRTALRVRNPRNGPDSTDVRVLERLTASVAAGDPLPSGVVEPGPGQTVRYYRPLPTQAFCTSCHGPVDELDPAVLALLREHYPEDQAVGFREGDLRGVVRVIMARSRLQPGG